MVAIDLKEKILGKTLKDDFHIIAFTPNGKSWWHVHNDEDVPEDWALIPFPNGQKWQSN